MSEVLYRKWRPQSFSEVFGHEAIVRTLRNSVSQARLGHAYLLCGPRGTGKTTLGRLLAKAVNCTDATDGEPCNKCESCLAFAEGRAMDFIEQDAASHNGVDDIRQLRENVVLTPMSGGRKVYLLDEVHMLSPGAENALLKTLEEPPPHIIFVLATTDPHKVAATIISRCQRFDLKRIPLAAVTQRLADICDKEDFTLDERSLEEIARAATGSLRDAINGLEQVITYYGKSPSLEQVQEALGLTIDARAGELARLALAGDLGGGLRLIAGVRDDGIDTRKFAKQVARYIRGLLLAKAGASEALDLPREAAEAVKTEATELSRGDIMRALRAFGRIEFRDDPQSSLPLELALMDYVAGSEAAPPSSAERPATAARTTAPAPQPVAPAPRPTAAVSPQAPRPEPKFSIPAAETSGIESTVTSATLEPAAEAEPPSSPGGTVPAAPAPREATRVPRASAGGGLLDRVRQACKDTEMPADKQLGALLNGSCEVKSEEGDTVVLGFYHTFHLERVESGGLAQRLQQLFSGVLGRNINLVFEHAPRERPEASAQPKGGHLVQAAREMGARAIPPTNTEGGP